MMAKISGILPSNPRITTVDVENERPIRPGTPTFGQPIAQKANPRDEFRRTNFEDAELGLASTYSSDGKITARDVAASPEVVTAFEKPSETDTSQRDAAIIDKITNKIWGKEEPVYSEESVEEPQLDLRV